MKLKSVIGFRLDDEMREHWETALRATGASDSELARACVQEGFKKAVAKMIRDRKEAEEALFFKESDRPLEVSPFGSGCGIPSLSGVVFAAG